MASVVMAGASARAYEMTTPVQAKSSGKLAALSQSLLTDFLRNLNTNIHQHQHQHSSASAPGRQLVSKDLTSTDEVVFTTQDITTKLSVLQYQLFLEKSAPLLLSDVSL